MAAPERPSALTLSVLLVHGAAAMGAMLARKLSASPLVAAVHKAPDAATAIVMLQQVQVDVMFVHVDLPGLDGVEFTRVVRQFAAPPPVVLVAAEPIWAAQAYDVEAADFVVASADPARFAEALRRLVRRVNEARPGAAPALTNVDVHDRADRRTPGDRRRTGDLPPSAVRWAEASGDFVRIHTSTSSLLVAGPLTSLVEEWSAAGIARTHRSYAVQLAAVTELRRLAKGYAVVVDGRELPVSRRAAQLIKDRLRSMAA